MKFGQLTHPEETDFTMPETPRSTTAILNTFKSSNSHFKAFVGMPRWNKKDFKGIYPKGTKDDLRYYSSQFNALEFNGTFYKTPSKEQVRIWRDRTVDGFCFCPKISQSISHYSRLKNCQEKLLEFVDNIAHFEDKLGLSFLQLHDNFKPKDFERLAAFLENFPKGIPLALEVRNEAWFSDKEPYGQLLQCLRSKGMTNIIVDTPGRRDVLHMQLSSGTAFIRFVACNLAVDFERLANWVLKIDEWQKAGLQELYFFIHQDLQTGHAPLAPYFIQALNKKLKNKLPIPFLGNL